MKNGCSMCLRVKRKKSLDGGFFGYKVAKANGLHSGHAFAKGLLTVEPILPH